MAKLDRKNVKIFSSNPNDATQVTTFLTAKDATPSISSDPDIIQNANYEKGWLAEGNNNLPQCEDMNGVMFTESYKTAYLYQQGIAEWIVTQEYCTNSFCQVAGVLYQSKTDNNIGNDPTEDDGTNWTEISLAPYNGDNLGTAEGIFVNKTANNVLQFKGLAVSGNGNISASNDTITIEIGGGGTGDVYWGAIGGTLSNQSDLQQALNLKQNLIGYTPENVSNKVTTVRTSSVATDTAYASEKATRTAIDNAIIEANNYTDNTLTNLSTNAFVLYANSWTDINTGTLTTTAPTGTGFPHLIQLSESYTYEDIANFTYTTTQETKFNNTFTYNVLMPIRNVRPKKWSFKFKLSIQHQDVNNGLEFQIFQTDDMEFIVDLLDNLNFQFRQDLINISEITYPAGSTIKLNIKAKSRPDTGETSNYDFDLLVYDEQYPLVISRNKGINKFYSTSLITQTLGDELNQESFNTYIYNLISGKQNKISGFNFQYSSTPYEASISPVDGTITTNIGTSTYPVTSIDCGTVNTTNVEVLNVYSDYSQLTMAPTNSDDVYFDLGTSGDQSTGSYYFRINDTTKFRVRNADVRTYADLLPSKNNAYDLGSSSNIFAEGYFNNTISNTVTTDEIASKTTVTPNPNTPAVTTKSVVINNFELKKWVDSDTNQTAVDISSTVPVDANNIATLGFYRKFNSINVGEVVTASIAPTTGNTSININCKLLPATNAIDLGDSSNKFQMAFIGSTYTGSLHSTGTALNVYSNLVPTSGQYLGSSTKAYGKTYTDEINVATIVGTATSPNTGSIIAKGRFYLYDGTTEKLQFGFSQCIPASHKAYNLGSNSNSFNGIFGASFVNTSDIRLKENVEEYKVNALDKINNLTPITYNFKDEDKENIKLGLSAQEVKKHEPLCVTGNESEEDYLGIDIYAINTLCIKAIKELNGKIKKLEARVEELEGK